MGRTEFEEWSDRIVSGAMVGSDIESQKVALCYMLMQLAPTIHMKEDIHFISQLRKAAVNQVADTIRRELHDKIKTRTAEEEAKAKAEQETIAALDSVVENTQQRIEAH